MKSSAEEKVYIMLRALYENQPTGVISSEVAKSMNLSRNAISHYLNRLDEKGLVTKTRGKPVYWKPSLDGQIVKDCEKEQCDAFGAFIGGYGCLQEAVDQCKAAVKYPPNGLPIIITGQSGVGKSSLAKLVYKYAIAEKIVANSTPFITFNCADYANNPQLLSGALFGYKKGAFTGANTDRSGIIQEANNGFLFLDEVHRLSFENQEKLFMVMDQGWYRPLGDNKTQNNVSIRFIFATTENVNEVLLETFRRRIAVKIEIIPFAQRPVSEKLDLISHFYRQEARSINKRLTVMPEVLSYLCFSKIEGNIGMLENIIKLSCANAFNNQKDKDMLTITSKNLPSAGLGFDGNNGKVFSKGLMIDNDDVKKNNSRMLMGEESFLESFVLLLSKNSSMDAIRSLKQEFEAVKCSWHDDDALNHIQKLYESLFETALNGVLRQYGIWTSNDEFTMAFRSYLFCQKYVCLHAPKIQAFEHLIQQEYPRSVYVVNKVVHQIKSVFKDENVRTDIFAALLFFLISPKITEGFSLHGLIIAHGESTATSLASVANNLCNTFVFEAFDMPMHTSVKNIIEKVNEYINTIDTRQGLILLVDMGSLDQMYSSIKNNLHGDLLIINNVSTSMAADIGIKIKNRENFRRIAEYAKTGYMSDAQYFEGFAPGENIIISCISGLGIANKIKEIIDEYVNHDLLEIVTMDYRTLKQALSKKDVSDFKDTKLIITTSGLKSRSEINILNLSNIWQPEGERLLFNGLKNSLINSQFDRLKSELLEFFSMEGVSSKLLFLNPKVIINEIGSVIDQYEKIYNIKLESYKRFNLYLHIAVMIERLMVGNQKDNVIIDETEAMNEFVENTKRILADISKKYNIEINHYEIILLYELFTS